MLCHTLWIPQIPPRLWHNSFCVYCVSDSSCNMRVKTSVPLGTTNPSHCVKVSIHHSSEGIWVNKSTAFLKYSDLETIEALCEPFGCNLGRADFQHSNNLELQGRWEKYRMLEILVAFRLSCHFSTVTAVARGTVFLGTCVSVQSSVQCTFALIDKRIYEPGKTCMWASAL